MIILTGPELCIILFKGVTLSQVNCTKFKYPTQLNKQLVQIRLGKLAVYKILVLTIPMLYIILF